MIVMISLLETLRWVLSSATMQTTTVMEPLMSLLRSMQPSGMLMTTVMDMEILRPHS